MINYSNFTATTEEIRQAQFLSYVKIWPFVHKLVSLCPFALPTPSREDIEDEVYSYLEDQISVAWFDQVKKQVGMAPIVSTFWLNNVDVKNEIKNDAIQVTVLLFPVKKSYVEYFKPLTTIIVKQVRIVLTEFWAAVYDQYTVSKI